MLATLRYLVLLWSLCWCLVLKSLGASFILVDTFYSLASYLALKFKKISRCCFFKFILPLSPHPLLVPLSVPYPLSLPNAYPHRKIPQFLMPEPLVNTSKYIRDSEDRQTPKVLWIVVAILWMIFGCSLSTLGKFESFLWPLFSWQPVLGLGVIIFSEDHSLEKQELFITAI